MKVQKSKWKKVLSLLLAGVLTMSSLNYSGLSVSATEAGSEEVPEVKEVPEETPEDLETPEEIFYVEEEYIPLDEIQTSAIGMSFFSGEGDSLLIDGNAVEWIDRLNIPQEALDFYDALEEGSDNDGNADILIDSTNFDGDYTIPVFTVTGQADSKTAMEAAIGEEIAFYGRYIAAAYNAFDRDHPEVFWLSGTSGVGGGYSYNSAWEYTLTIYFVMQGVDGYGNPIDVRAANFKNTDVIKSAISARDSRVTAILNGFTGNSTYEKLQYFNDTLTKTNEYNTSANLDAIAHECRECTSALSGSIGTVGPVCEAYARAFKVLCDKSGIPCVLVDGQAKNSADSAGEAHMWNYVQLDGVWYAVDVTWNDPTGGASGAESGFESEDWFLVGSDTVIDGMSFITSHPVSNQVSSSGPAFTNGPSLNAAAYEEPEQALPTTLNVVVEPGETVTYGEQITIKVQAVSDSGEVTSTADASAVSLWFDSTRVAEAVSAENGVYIINYSTLERKIPIGTHSLTVKFDGGKGSNGSDLAPAEEDCRVIINQAQPVVSFANADLVQTFDYTGREPEIAAPKVNLVSVEDTAGTISYQHQNVDSTEEWINGLPINAGTYKVKAVVLASADGYYSEAVSNTIDLVIQKSQPTITISDDWSVTKDYDGKPFEKPTEADVTVTGASYNDIKFSWHGVASEEDIYDSTRVEAVVHAGTYMLLAEISESENTKAAKVTKEITVTKRPVTVNAKPVSKIYGESDPEFTYEIDAATPLVAGESLSGELERATGENAGTYSILAGTLTNANNSNYEITYIGANLTIQKKTYTVECSNDQTVVYGQGTFAEPKFVTTDGTAVSGILTYSYDNNELTYSELVTELKKIQKDVTGTISYNFTPDNTNYEGPTTGTISFVVKDIEFTVNDGSTATAANAVTVKENPVYGDTWNDILTIKGITASVGTAKDNDASHFTVDVTGSPNAGIQTFRIYYNGTIAGNMFTNVVVCEGTVEIAKRTLTVTEGTTKVSKVYDGTTAAGTITGNLHVTGGLTGDDVTAVIAFASYSDANAGAQTQMTVDLALNGNAKDNYVLAETSILVPCEITRKPVTIIATAGNKVYGETEPELVYTVSGTTPLVSGESLTGELSREAGENAGTYQIFAGTLTNANNQNYDITYTGAAFTITKKTVTVAAGDYKVSKVYDGTDTVGTVTGSVEANGILNTDNVTVKVTPETFTNVNAGGQSNLAVNLELTGVGADNYELSQASIFVPCEITKRPVSVKADALRKTYGESDPVFTYTMTETLPETADDLSGELTRTTGENAGTYSILQGTLTNTKNPNYEITYTGADFTIDKAVYTVNLLENQTVVYEIGAFAEPEFVAGSNQVAGTLTYTYGNQSGLTYAEVAAELEKLQPDAKGTISYSFTPADVNYEGPTAGTIQFVVKDIVFTVDGSTATAENAVTVKENPVYGDAWEDILNIKVITASVGTAEDNNASHFTVDVTGSPNAGTQTFNIYYNGTILGKTYTDVIVCTGNVEIGKKELTVTAGSAKATKEYDGTTAAGVLSGEVKIDGVLTNDEITVTAQPKAFTDANAGVQTSVEAALTLGGSAAENYKLGNAEVAIPCEITKRPVTVQAEAASKIYGEDDPVFTYTIADATPLVTGEALLGALGRESGENAGTYQMTLGTLAEQNKNYAFTLESAVFTIEKAVYTGEKTGKATAIYGNTGSFDAASILPEGAKLGQPAAADNTVLLKDSLAVNGTVLTWKVIDDEALIGKTAEITLPVTESTNYLPYDITITVTVSEKQKQEGFAFKNTVVEKVYGDAEFVSLPTGAAKDSKITYTSSNEKIAKVDVNGKVQILGVGSVTITASASETATYLPAETAYTLKIAKKALTWDVSELSALDREDCIENNKATLAGKLMVSGILDVDKKDVIYNCPADILTGIYKETTPGTQTVLLLWAKVNGAPVLEGDKAGNYTLPTVLPNIEGTINEVYDDFKFEISGTDNTSYKLVAEKGISWDSVDTGKWYYFYDTPEKIENFMYERIQSQFTDVSRDSVFIYDIDLQWYKAGEGWKAVTKEEFPKDGLAIEVPYPEGTGKDTHDFAVSHVFTDDMNGYKAGDVENPKVTKTDTGIRFLVNGLSPIAIGWKEIETETIVGGSWYYDPEIDGIIEEDNDITETGNKKPVKNPNKAEELVDTETDDMDEYVEESTEVIEDTQETEQEISESTESISETENAEKTEDVETDSTTGPEKSNGFSWFIALIVLLLAAAGVIFVNKKKTKK